ncbi:hypothetical protein C0J52_08523 [Blattella germanica]|nr:hypothetical protein C0J52_08523 [Blattella germanica]
MEFRLKSRVHNEAKIEDDYKTGFNKENKEDNKCIALKNATETDANVSGTPLNADLYEFRDPSRYQEINEAFEDLNVALCEMQDALQFLDKPPEMCLQSMEKLLEKKYNALKEMGFLVNTEKDATKNENLSSSRVELNVLVKSPHKGVTENIKGGIVVEPLPRVDNVRPTNVHSRSDKMNVSCTKPRI